MEANDYMSMGFFKKTINLLGSCFPSYRQSLKRSEAFQACRVYGKVAVAKKLTTIFSTVT